jgi:hypothetical protein
MFDETTMEHSPWLLRRCRNLFGESASLDGYTFLAY